MSSVGPQDVVAPGPAVAEASVRIMSDLAILRQAAGPEAMQVQAMAMHNAAIAVLRPDIGFGGIRQMVALTGAENDRIEARDRENAETGRRRRVAAAARQRWPR